MENLAINNQTDPVFQEYGKVIEQNQQSFMVETPTGKWSAKQAVSCLIEPRVGDKVLLAFNSNDISFILAILKRDTVEPYTLQFDRDIQIKVTQGRLALASKNGIDIASENDIRLMSSNINMHAKHGELSIDSLSYIGTILQTQINRIRLFSDIVDSVIGRFTQKIKRSYRFIEESEQVKAERINYDVSNLYSVKGKYTIVTAEKDIKIDGESIHVG